MYSLALESVLENQARTTDFTKRVTFLPWSYRSRKKFITFRLASPLITYRQCELNVLREFAEEGISTNELTQQQVEVKVLNLDWLLKDAKNFLDFSFLLKRSQNKRIFQTEFLQQLVQEFWDESFYKILYRIFMPWLLYMICALYFFATQLGVLSHDEEEHEVVDTVYAYSIGCLTIILLIYQVVIEGYQLAGSTFKEYIFTFPNAFDIFQLLSTFTIVAMNLHSSHNVNTDMIRVVAAVSVFLLWMKMFDWLRLFEPTSFYIKLVTATFSDMSSFMLLFLTGLAMFGSSMYMLQLSSQSSKDTIIESNVDHFFLDSLINQYLIALGEFAMDGFEAHPQWYFCWLLFLSSTFFTQIVLLNMLIAIMSNTYEFIIDRKAQFALQNKMTILSEYYNVIDTRNKQERDLNNYLFIVAPSNDYSAEDSTDDWQGSFSFMKKDIERRVNQLELKFEKTAS